MSLKTYRKKRNFRATSEPSSAAGPLTFCVQKHAARRLHYDVRLEYKGALLSWAVPKGPSLDPKDKRLAVKVEDHPLGYQYFEGRIPPGNYGAGTVEIWDRGTYRAVEGSTRKEMEAYLKEGLSKGHFAVILTGKKLHGEFVFQKLKKDPDDTAWLLIKKQSKALPGFISPMLATLIKEPFSDAEWAFEVKWDGYRALAWVSDGKVELKSRNNRLFTQFQLIQEDLKAIPGEAIFDGEIVVLDAKGRSSFPLIQNYQKTGQGTLVYYIFDLLYRNGKDLRPLPLVERKRLLEQLLKKHRLARVRYSKHILKEGKRFFQAARKQNLEGMIGKKLSAPYVSRRTLDWVKVKTSLRQEVVIGGFTAPQGLRKKFGALLVGVYDEEGKLTYAGHVGGGFNAALLNDVYEKLKPLIRSKCPFKDAPRGNTQETWVRPKLLCEVAFSEWTQGNIMRQPIFQGLREDKMAKTVQKEVPKKVILTHLDKVYWPRENYTKGDLLAYYEAIAPYLLPYLKDRPIMLHRYPNGILESDFYQKDMKPPLPKGIKTFPVAHEGKKNHYLLIDTLESLLYAVNLGSIDFHPFMSRCKHLDRPDYCVIDLDPHGISFKKVTELALVIHETLDKIRVKHVCKTSGGNGLHIFIPLHGKYTTEQSKQFAQILAQYVHAKLPKTTSLERSPQKRPKKIYIDCLQNRYGQTAVAPYAVRPRPGAYVSTPLEWKELNDSLTPAQFTMETVPQRLKKKGDLFLPVLKQGINLEAALQRLQRLIDSG